MLGADEKTGICYRHQRYQTQFGAANLEIFGVATKECEPAQLGQGERTASPSPN